MKIVLCIASRGRPRLLRKTVCETLENIMLDDTKIVVAIDSDDQPSIDIEFDDPRVVVSVAKREHTLGAKYNRSAAAVEDGDLYINGVDDVSFKERGWDRKIVRAFESQFTDGYGLVFVGKASYETYLPAMIAVSRDMVNAVGFYMPPYFPFWWHDTWWFEIAQFTQRVVTIDCDVAHYEGAPKTQRLRDVAFWATLFDLMRGWRVESALKVINAMAPGDLSKEDLANELGPTSQKLFQANANLRDFFGSVVLAGKIGDASEADKGYDAAKRKGDELFAELSASFDKQRSNAA